MYKTPLNFMGLGTQRLRTSDLVYKLHRAKTYSVYRSLLYLGALLKNSDCHTASQQVASVHATSEFVQSVSAITVTKSKAGV